MSNEAKTLIELARALPPEDRIALVEDVLDSLDHTDADIDQLWAREATDRLAAYRRGELAAKDLSEIVKRARGVVDSGVSDLASDPGHLTGFGRDARPR